MAEFYTHPRMTDGHLNVCKVCFRAKVKANREAKAERYKDYDRRRAMLPHRVEARARYAATREGAVARGSASRRYTERNPVRRAVHVITGNAIKSGRLVKQPCEVCGSAEVRAHHDDYAFPLSVRWLCPAHHTEWHRHNEPANG